MMGSATGRGGAIARMENLNIGKVARQCLFSSGDVLIGDSEHVGLLTCDRVIRPEQRPPLSSPLVRPALRHPPILCGLSALLVLVHAKQKHFPCFESRISRMAWLVSPGIYEYNYLIWLLGSRTVIRQSNSTRSFVLQFLQCVVE